MQLFYKGPSMLDGKPIIGLLTGETRPSHNAKTGPMIQTWILREDISPIEATRSHEDFSICGDCLHRRASLGTCYVNVARAPTAIFKKYHRDLTAGTNLDLNIKKLIGRALRLGAYGDPCAIPMEAWKPLLTVCHVRTGYTHQWHNDNPAFQQFKHFIQASVESIDEQKLAQSMGWGTFRIKGEHEAKQANEFVCPSSQGITCLACHKCDGDGTSVVIDVHGLRHKVVKFNECHASQEGLWTPV